MSDNNAIHLIKYDVGTNFDPQLIDVINTYNQDKKFVSVFGKFRSDLVGGGRASMILPDPNLKELKTYIEKCKKHEIKFNYLLNPICMANKELMRSFHKKFLRFVQKLIDIGVDGITLNSPYLCELIKKRFPGLSITTGVWTDVYSVRQVKWWEDLGANNITLKREASRNFKLLEQLFLYAKKSGTGLRIFPNSICLRNCPFSINHATGSSHASVRGNDSFNLYLDYNFISCNTRRISSPTRFISSNWIRPEDIVYYEELCKKTGYNHLTMKLLDRTKTTAYLERVIKAYAQRKYNGNLLDILNYADINHNQKIHRGRMYFQAIKGRYNIKSLKKFISFFQLPKIYIDNNKLNGFFKKFVMKFNCDEMICDDSFSEKHPEEGMNNNSLCGYCKTWAKKVVSFDRNKIDDWVKISHAVLNDFKSSKIMNIN